MSAILLLSGCGNDPRGLASEKKTPILPPAAEQAKTARILPKADFWAPLLAGIAGTYDSECEPVNIEVTGMEAQAPLPGPITVMPDGKVRSAGESLNLRTQSGVSVERTVQAGQKVHLSMDAMSAKLMTLALQRQEGSDWVLFGLPNKLKRCKVTSALPLSRQSLYASFAKVLDADTQVECVSAAAPTSEGHRYQLAKGMLRVAGLVVDLNKPSRETATIHPDAGFIYSADVLAEERFMVMLDAQGQLNQLYLPGKKGKALVCFMKR